MAGRVLWFYPRTLLWPRELTFIYPRWSIDAQVWWQYLFPIAAVAVLAGLYAARRRLGTGPLIAALCYAGMLAPALGFFNVYPMRYSFVADHFAYLPSLALIALGGGHRGAARRTHRRQRAGYVAAAPAAALLLLVLAVLTARQCGIYRDLRTLWTDTLAKNPGCWMAHNNFAMVLAGDGHLDDAIAHYREAVRLRPDFAEAHSNLGVALADQGQGRRRDRAVPARPCAGSPMTRKRTATWATSCRRRGRSTTPIAEYGAALQARPVVRGRTLQSRGDTRRAGEDGRGARALRPGPARQPRIRRAHNNIGNLLRGQGQLDAAIAHYTEALRLRPAYAEAENNLGVALAMQGKTTAALAHLEQALRVKPDYVEAYSNAGNVLQAQGRFAEAVAQYEEALRLQPTNADAHNNLGMALLAQGKKQGGHCALWGSRALEARQRSGAQQPRRRVTRAGVTPGAEAPLWFHW